MANQNVKVDIHKFITISLMGIIFFVLQGFLGQTTVSADYCGIPDYEASIQENAKRCSKQWNNTYICTNNGLWECNGTYKCSTSIKFTGGCYSQANTASCDMFVWAQSYSGKFANDCYIYNNGYSCAEESNAVTAGCWVSGSNEPCKSCVGSNCEDTGGAGCQSDLNECNNNADCAPPPSTKTCSVALSSSSVPAGNPVTVTLSGNTYTAGSEEINLWLEKRDGQSISNYSSITPSVTQWTSATGHYYYKIASGGCSSSGSNPCTKVTGVTIPAAGDYYFHCDAETDPGKCSGNPFCPYEGLGGTENCTGWTSCSASDNKTFDATCSATAPTNLVVTRLSPTQGRLNWTPGANGIKQLLRVGANLTEVNSGCPGTGSPACVVKEDNLPTTQTSYTTGNVLVAGTVYYWRVVNFESVTCPNPDARKTAISSCAISPSSLSLEVGSSGTMTSSVNSSSEISSVNYVPASALITTVSPNSDTTYPYRTTATGVSAGSTTVRNDVIIGGSTNCTANSNITVTAPGPWWQVKDADVTTNGNLISTIPSSCTLPACNPVFGLKGDGVLPDGGFPGVPAYGGATADFQAGAGTGRAAEDPYNWLVNSRYNGKTYDYAYFERQIPDDVVINELAPPVTGGTFNSGGTPSRGYVWYHWNGATRGDLTISGNVNLVGSRKVVLMVEGANLTINGKINLQNPGSGFFMAVVGKDATGLLKGDIIISPGVTGSKSLEGIFLAESEFKTGAGSGQLHVRGSVVAYDGIVLERDLGASNANTAAELFEYAPDIIATFPRVFTQRRIRWKEVAP